MRGLLIVIFAVCLFALTKLCCEEKRTDADMMDHDSVGYPSVR